MHVYTIIRGQQMWVDEFIKELQGKYLPFKWNINGEIKDCNFQIGVHPIQLYEITFPEGQKDIVLATIFPDGKGGETQHPKHKKFIWGIRKMLGIEPMPQDYKIDMKMPICMQNMEVVGIGIKKDYWINPKTGEKFNNPTEEQKKDLIEGL